MRALLSVFQDCKRVTREFTPADPTRRAPQLTLRSNYEHSQSNHAQTRTYPLGISQMLPRKPPSVSLYGPLLKRNIVSFHFTSLL